MAAFEYLILEWNKNESEAEFSGRLNAAGAERWELVGLAPRGASVPMPGMGSSPNIPNIVAVLKRRQPS